MEDGFKNIDEIFKKAFNGFESNVEPNVWNNIQNSLSSSVGSTPQIDSSFVSGVAGKSLSVKIITGVALIGVIATSTYFVLDFFENSENITIDNIVIQEDPIKAIEKIGLPVIENEEEVAEILIAENEAAVNPVILEEDVVVNENLTIETIKIERQANSSSENTEQATSEKKGDPKPLKNTNTTAIKSVKNVTKNMKKVAEPVELLVKLNADIIQGTAPLTVHFDAYGEGAEQYFWDFSDKSSEVNEISPIHVFKNEGTYRVKLTGIDNQANSKNVYLTIIVEKDYSSSIQDLPNIFSPNGDGVNDIIKIKGKNIDKIQVQIMDSKGRPVYFMDSMDDSWDGKDQSGNYLIQGQYYMTVNAIGKDGKKHSKKSAINLRK